MTSSPSLAATTDATLSPSLAAIADDILLSPALFRIKLETNEQGATVTEEGKFLCRTPCPMHGRPGEKRRVWISKRGFVSQRKTIRFDRPGTVRVKLEPESLSEKDGLKGSSGLSGEDGLK